MPDFGLKLVSSRQTVSNNFRVKKTCAKRMWDVPTGPLLRLLELLLVEWCNTDQWPRPATPMDDGSERGDRRRRQRAHQRRRRDSIGFADVETVAAASRHRRWGERVAAAGELDGSVTYAPRSAQRDGAGALLSSPTRTTSVAVDLGDATPRPTKATNARVVSGGERRRDWAIRPHSAFRSDRVFPERLSST